MRVRRTPGEARLQLKVGGRRQSAEQRGELLTNVGCPGDSPATLGGLGQQDRRAGGLTRIANDAGDDLGRVRDKLPLPVTGQGCGRRHNLDTDGPRGVGAGGMDR
jgi:hypothetical protein